MGTSEQMSRRRWPKLSRRWPSSLRLGQLATFAFIKAILSNIREGVQGVTRRWPSCPKVAKSVKPPTPRSPPPATHTRQAVITASITGSGAIQTAVAVVVGTGNGHHKQRCAIAQAASGAERRRVLNLTRSARGAG